MNAQLIASARKSISEIHQASKTKQGQDTILTHRECLASYITDCVPMESLPINNAITFSAYPLKRKQIEQIINDTEYIYYLTG